MAKLTRDKIYEAGIFDPLKKGAQDALVAVVALGEGIRQQHNDLAKLSKMFDGTSKAQRALYEQEKQSAALMQQKIKTDEMQIRLEKEHAKLLQEEERILQQKNKTVKTEFELDKAKLSLDEKIRKEAERKAKAEKALGGEYAKQSRRLTELRNQYKDLIIVQGKETKQTLAMRKEIESLDKTLKRIDASVGQHTRNVGNYERAINGVTNVLGQLGIAFGVFHILRDAFNIVKANEDAFASLSAITGLTGEKFEVFREALNKTADDLNVSSTAVAEAAEKIASAQPKLLESADALAEVTKQAIILNKAIKGDLTETSLALVGVMNQFGEEASEAENIINILAAGSKAGAASVNQINESIVKFGTTADLMNITIEESVGLIETLGEKAIFGADAGTALRNILLKMSAIDVLPEKAQKQLEKYGVNVDIVKDKSLSFEERLIELSKVAKDSTAIMQIFGTENATAATVLLNNLGTYHSMTDAVTGTNVAQEQAAINSATLSETINELRAAWENYVVGILNGTDAMGGLKAMLKFVADNLKTIMTFLMTGIRFWIAYRLQVALLGKEFAKLSFGQVLDKLKGMAMMLPKMTLSVKGLATAMKSIPFIGWISALVSLAPLIIDFVGGLFSAEKEVKELTLAQKTLNHVSQETEGRLIEEEAKLMLVFDQLKATTAGTKERQDMLDYVNGKYGTTLKNLSDEGEFVRQLDMAYEQLIATMEKRIRQEVVQEDLTALIKQKLQLQKRLLVEQDIVNKQMAETNKTFTDVNADQLFGDMGRTPAENMLKITQQALQDVEDAIAALKGDVEGSNFFLPEVTQAPGTGGTSKVVDEEKRKMDILLEMRRKHAAKLIEIENDLIQAGYAREIIDMHLFEFKKDFIEQELVLIQDLNFKTTDEYEKTLNERLKMIDTETKKLELAKVERIKIAHEEAEEVSSIYTAMAEMGAELAKKQAEDRAKAIKNLRDSIVDAANLIEEFMNKQTEAIDRQIEKINDEVEASKSREEQLRQEAKDRGLNADEAITVERERQKAMLIEKEKLEAKKREIEVMLIMLRAFAAAMENGQGNPVANIKSQVTDIMNFAKNLPAFIDGTETTLGKTMKQNIPGSGKDKFLIKADKDERILNPRLSGMIPENVTNAELVHGYLHSKAARHVQNSFEANASASSDRFDFVLYDKLDKLIQIQEELPDRLPETDTNYNAMIGALEHTRKHNNRTQKFIYYIRG